MNIFELAELQLKREGLLNKPNETVNLIDRAIKIRNFFDLSKRQQLITCLKSRGYENENVFKKW